MHSPLYHLLVYTHLDHYMCVSIVLPMSVPSSLYMSISYIYIYKLFLQLKEKRFKNKFLHHNKCLRYCVSLCLMKTCQVDRRNTFHCSITFACQFLTHRPKKIKIRLCIYIITMAATWLQVPVSAWLSVCYLSSRHGISLLMVCACAWLRYPGSVRTVSRWWVRL